MVNSIEIVGLNDYPDLKGIETMNFTVGIPEISLNDYPDLKGIETKAKKTCVARTASV